jgi:ribosomal protein L16 Arg81 hydroxylase
VDAHRQCIRVNEGESLYIPSGWWHEVFTPLPCLMINYWFTASTIKAQLRSTIMYLHSSRILRFLESKRLPSSHVPAPPTPTTTTLTSVTNQS